MFFRSASATPNRIAHLAVNKNSDNMKTYTLTINYSAIRATVKRMICAIYLTAAIGMLVVGACIILTGVIHFRMTV